MRRAKSKNSPLKFLRTRALNLPAKPLPKNDRLSYPQHDYFPPLITVGNCTLISARESSYRAIDASAYDMYEDTAIVRAALGDARLNASS